MTGTTRMSRTETSTRCISTEMFTLSLLFCFCGCSLFRSPDPNDVPKSKYDVEPASYTDGPPDPDKQKPLLDPESLKSENIRRNFKSLIGQGADKTIAQAAYERGRVAYERASENMAANRAASADFVTAAEEFTVAADRWQDSALEQDSLFMAGESYFFADHYVDANKSWELLVKKYPNSRHLDTVEARRFLIAKYWLMANDKEPYAFYQFNLTNEERPWYDTRGHALRVFDKIQVDDPTGKLADDAVMARANEHFAKGEFEKADQYFTDLIKAHPDSEHQFNAHYLGLKAKLNSYRGSDYAGESLDEGEKLIKQMRRQFPRDAAQEREFLDRAFAEIRYKQAERNWRMASYYDRRAEYGGAKYYYGIVEREYDDTPFSARAKTRLGEIANEPDQPPKPLKFIADWFPESDKLKPILEKAMVQPGEVRR
jgi:outer membrane protein assembly factor BamD (BamD/ComL family)